MNHNPYNLQEGDRVIIDKDFNNSGEVTIVTFTPDKMFAMIREDGKSVPWKTMTARLSPIEEHSKDVSDTNVGDMENSRKLKEKVMNKKEIIENLDEAKDILQAQAFACKNDPEYPDVVDQIELHKAVTCIEEVLYLIKEK